MHPKQSVTLHATQLSSLPRVENGKQVWLTIRKRSFFILPENSTGVLGV